ncbi:MAG: hypothetical protein ACFB0D_24625 [Phormidesmis sp.]
MQIPQEPPSDINAKSAAAADTGEQRMKAIAYSLDALVPGVYLWCGPLKIRLWGSLPEENYPGTIHRLVGMAVVLPGYRIFSTYRGSYDAR